MLTIRFKSLFFSLAVLLLFSLLSICHGQSTSPPCSPSSCGNIRNITFPFRLKTDPKNCGNPNYELECQNNLTILNLKSQRYHVLSINYDLYRIRIVDPALENNNSCSFPLKSPQDIISDNYVLYSPYGDLNTRLTFINCRTPVNSSKYVDITFCRNASSSSNSSQIRNYIVAGEYLTLSDLEPSCSVEKETRVVNLPDTHDYTSLSGIHEAVTNGIEISWYYPICVGCYGVCSIEDNSIRCRRHTICYEDTPYSERTFRCKLDYWLPVIVFFGVFPIVGILGIRFLCGLSGLIALVVYKKKRRNSWLECENVEDLYKSPNQFQPLRYSYSQIKKMTHNFQDKLGVGVYGTVFKGKLRSGPPAAVKVMDKSMANPQEFFSVVAALGSARHVNLMQLVGFCSEGQERALVHDFMPNGSLQKYISAREGESVPLSYENMYKISLGVARGIDYLHKSSYGNQISHFGIKPHNILLDDNLIPKIADFGLTKLYPRLSYTAPEFYYKSIGDVSHRSDVYSFGMLLMEMISCRKKDIPSLAEHGSSSIGLHSWADNQLLAEKNIEIGNATEEERKVVKKMIKVALWCIQMKPADRPFMSKVLEMLEVDDAELLQMPPKPSVIPQE